MSRRIGSHEVEVEGDLLQLHARGPFTLKDMKEFTDLAEVHAQQIGYLLILNDLREAQTLSAEVRRYSAERARETKQRGSPIYAASAAYGAGPVVRGLAALYFAMLRLVSDGAQNNIIAKSEAEARAYLDEQRRIFQSKLAAR